MQKNAILDVVMCEKDWLRCHTFNPRWSDAVSMGHYDNGAGDHLFAFFSRSACIIKGFDHESPVSPYALEEFHVWPGMYDKVPRELLKVLEDKTVEKEHVTFCIWWSDADDSWKTGELKFPNGEDDGSSFLLGAIFTAAEDYWDWAQSYFESEIDRGAVQAIYDGKPVTDELVQRLNPKRSPTAVRLDLQTILGIPHSSRK